MTPILQAIAVCVTTFFAWRFARWILSRNTLDNVQGPATTSFWKGHLSPLFNRHGWDFHRELSEKYGSVVSLRGVFGRKVLYIFDPKAMHHVCVKEQNIYEETRGFLVANRILFGANLLSSAGDAHRQQRKFLNPVFSINHMRHMIPIFNNVSDRLRIALKAAVEKDSGCDIDMTVWMSRVALELIGQAGLGYSFDPLTEEVVHPYASAIKALPAQLFSLEPLRDWLPYIYSTVPHSILLTLAKIIPSRRIRAAHNTAYIVWDACKEILVEKRAAIAAGKEAVSQLAGEGKDLLSVLLHENSKAQINERISDDDILGHMSAFIFAGTDTTSSALIRVLYVLAAHPEAQAKLRKELKEARADGQELSYDDLVSLPYMDAVCRETLRLYSPVPFMTRETNKDSVLPLHTPIKGKDGQLLDEIAVPANTMVIIGILASNRSQVLWGEDAHEWKPERWLAPLPESLTEARVPGVYSHLMTFFAGGRACIGFKFSQLEMKVILAMLIENFTFDLSPDKEIYWNFSGIVYPTVGPVDAQMQLPLRVALASRD
ncbi:cytochrome P450-dit2 [Steccherinum ochraceum]|uniref:Cytochrome P450-dit2 n=1 Tax=Steccherinum ochraceum TaxID=92696 RepID=A0A4R0R8W2_9APHY|nr:cytochrome P450-dit2 [Steccherinum ochraceum]